MLLPTKFSKALNQLNSTVVRCVSRKAATVVVVKALAKDAVAEKDVAVVSAVNAEAAVAVVSVAATEDHLAVAADAKAEVAKAEPAVVVSEISLAVAVMKKVETPVVADVEKVEIVKAEAANAEKNGKSLNQIFHNRSCLFKAGFFWAIFFVFITT